MIWKKQIKKCMKLLHNDYQNMETKITIYNSRLILFLSYLFNPNCIIDDFKDLENCFKGGYCGQHCMNKIELYIFNRRKIYKYGIFTSKIDKERFKVQIIYDIYHEIRHAYQYNYKNKKYCMLTSNYIRAGNYGYASQWVERDANAFAIRMLTAKRNEINKILKIKINQWMVIA